MRQDAVMEQVFGMVNQLLMKNSETRKRKLKMRTYKVRLTQQQKQWVCVESVYVKVMYDEYLGYPKRNLNSA